MLFGRLRSALNVNGDEAGGRVFAYQRDNICEWAEEYGKSAMKLHALNTLCHDINSIHVIALQPLTMAGM